MSGLSRIKRFSDGPAIPDELRAYQLTPSVCNSPITALRFFFGMTCNREDRKKHIPGIGLLANQT